MKKKDWAKTSRSRKYRIENRKIERLLGIENQSLDSIIDEDVFIADFLVLAPVMNIFVLWTLENALRKGIRRLYFLARDGYPAFLVADKYCKVWKLGIECQYLYCSRYALRVPMYSYNIEEAVEYICGGGMHVTWEKIFRRAGMNKEEMQVILSDLNEYIDLRKELSYSELCDVKKILEASKEFVDLLMDKSKKEWDMLYGYFRQEGLFLDDEIAVVDSGWIGTMQKSINDIRHRGGCTRDIEGFYFGLYDIPLGTSSKTYHSFLFTPKKRLLNKVFFSNCFYETVFSDNCGITIRYEKERENYVPVFGETNSINEKKISRVNREILKYADNIINNMDPCKIMKLPCDKLRKIIEKMMRMITWNPTIVEAEYYGTLEFSDGLLDEDKQELAKLINKRELTRNHVLVKILSILGIGTDGVIESAWFEGSAVRQGDYFKIHRLNYSIYKLLIYIKKYFN